MRAASPSCLTCSRMTIAWQRLRYSPATHSLSGLPRNSASVRDDDDDGDEEVCHRLWCLYVQQTMWTAAGSAREAALSEVL